MMEDRRDEIAIPAWEGDRLVPVDKIEAVRAVFEKAGMNMSEGMEWVVDTQVLRTR